MSSTAGPNTNTTSDPADASGMRSGYLFGLSAFGWWGVIVPLYFWALTDEELGGADPFEILAQRIVFGLPVLLGMLVFSRQFGPFLRAIGTWTSLRVLIPSTLLIAINWYFFIWSVANGTVSHASLGYYINPLVSVALGFVFLGERLSRAQWAAVCLAACAIAVLTWAEGTVPFVSIILPLSFGTYGLLRKRANVGPTVGLTFEMMLLLPVSAGLLVWLEHGQRGVFLNGPGWVSALMVLGGVVTIVPMICFTAAARLLPLSVLGMIQYIAPSLQLVVATAVVGERFPPEKWIAFALIWCAIAVFTADAFSRARRARKDQRNQPDTALPTDRSAEAVTGSFESAAR
ncbi:MAG: EamA family transporter RarD [Planctomycetota bacterium]